MCGLPKAVALPSETPRRPARLLLQDGAPYVWDGFASAAEIREANHALEEMFQRLLRWGKVGFNSWGARAGSLVVQPAIRFLSFLASVLSGLPFNPLKVSHF